MEPESQHAPPVVAVVVVHQPGSWFDRSLEALAAQDYPNLRHLFLIARSPGDTSGDDSEVEVPTDVGHPAHAGDDVVDAAPDSFDGIERRITAWIPEAFVRPLGANPGFGASANEVLRLVEGRNGFFLFCHDDIAPEPAAVRLMVEELYRSNAGLVGPKLVDWDDPGVLQTVGLGADRFGELSQPIEEGEVDQEQHDGVRDVFVLPTACLLARADLFREVGGFDPGIDLYGEDLEFCWRVHHSGARVVVAPTARVRHRSRLAERRPDVHPATRSARHRLRTVATLTGGARLPGRLLELVLLTMAELVVGLFTGRFRSAVASARALVGLIPRIPAVVTRRREVKPVRLVPEREVLGLQERGSARLASFVRSREIATFVGTETSVRRWRESTTAPVLAWIAVLAAFVFGSRSLLADGVPAVGEFLPFPDSPRLLFESWASGWNPNGLGASSPNPTGLATLAVLSFATLFRMALLHTLFVLGLVVVGLIGLWKLATVFPSTRARIAALLVYAASPLVGGALAIGSLSTLVAFAACPWIVHTLRRAVGVATADPRTIELDLADGLVDLSWSERRRRVLQAGLVVGLATAFVPVMLVVALLLGLTVALATLLALAPWRTALGYAGATLGATVVGALLNVAWIGSWSWDSLVDPPPVGDPGRGLATLAAFEIGPTDFARLAWAFYLPVVAAVLLAGAWRLTWAIRSGAIVTVFGALAVFGDRGSLPVDTPEAGILLAPVAVGVAISAAAAIAAFDLDVRGGSFGWRQPLGIVASAAVIVGLVPGVYAAGRGDWQVPSTTVATLIERQLPDVVADSADDDTAGDDTADDDTADDDTAGDDTAGGNVTPSNGDYNVLILGDARILPVPGVEYRDGVSYAVIGDDGLDIRDRWAAPETSGDEAIVDALDQISSGSTQRAGRLLAPLGIRFVVVPRIDGVVSTPDQPLPVPIGMSAALDEQLDIVAFPNLPTLEIYRNSAWLPVASVLSGPTAAASTSAGDAELVRADLGAAVAAFPTADHMTATDDDLDAGVMHLAVPFDDDWRLTVDGQAIPARRAFGVSTAFDLDVGGPATLAYSTPASRTALVWLNVALWLLAVFGALRVSVSVARPRTTNLTDETLISLGDDPDAAFHAPTAATLDPGLDMTGQIVRAVEVGGGTVQIAEGDDLAVVTDADRDDGVTDADRDAGVTDADRDAGTEREHDGADADRDDADADADAGTRHGPDHVGTDPGADAEGAR